MTAAQGDWQLENLDPLLRSSSTAMSSPLSSQMMRPSMPNRTVPPPPPQSRGGSGPFLHFGRPSPTAAPGPSATLTAHPPPAANAESLKSGAPDPYSSDLTCQGPSLSNLLAPLFPGEDGGTESTGSGSPIRHPIYSRGQSLPPLSSSPASCSSSSPVVRPLPAQTDGSSTPSSRDKARFKAAGQMRSGDMRQASPSAVAALTKRSSSSLFLPAAVAGQAQVGSDHSTVSGRIGVQS